MAYFKRTKTGKYLKSPKIIDFDYTRDVPAIDEIIIDSGMVGEKTIGKVISQEITEHTKGIMVECLDGEVRYFGHYRVLRLPEDALQEVKDFYAATGQGKKIKVNW